jgi:hypothetical protein
MVSADMNVWGTGIGCCFPAVQESCAGCARCCVHKLWWCCHVAVALAATLAVAPTLAALATLATM